jgi:phage tail-like protein
MLSSFRFVFTCEEKKIGFQKISGMSSKAEVEYIKEGGRIGGAYPVSASSVAAGKLTFEKGWGDSARLGVDWFKPGKRINKPCTILLFDESGSIKRAFGFDCGVVTAWECSGLDAEKSGLLIDTFVIEHSGLYEVSV